MDPWDLLGGQPGRPCSEATANFLFPTRHLHEKTQASACLDLTTQLRLDQQQPPKMPLALAAQVVVINKNLAVRWLLVSVEVQSRS